MTPDPENPAPGSPPPVPDGRWGILIRPELGDVPPARRMAQWLKVGKRRFELACEDLTASVPVRVVYVEKPRTRRKPAPLRRRVRELEAEIHRRDAAAKAVQASSAVQRLRTIRDRLEAREPWQMPGDWWKRGKPDTTEE